MKHKFDFFDTFFNLRHHIKTQFSAKIKSFQCDDVTEFINNKFHSHLHSYGIILHLVCPYTLSQNGIVKHKHRYVTEKILSHVSCPCSSLIMG